MIWWYLGWEVQDGDAEADDDGEGDRDGDQQTRPQDCPLVAASSWTVPEHGHGGHSRHSALLRSCSWVTIIEDDLPAGGYLLPPHTPPAWGWGGWPQWARIGRSSRPRLSPHPPPWQVWGRQYNCLSIYIIKWWQERHCHWQSLSSTFTCCWSLVGECVMLWCCPKTANKDWGCLLLHGAE